MLAAESDGQYEATGRPFKIRKLQGGNKMKQKFWLALRAISLLAFLGQTALGTAQAQPITYPNRAITVIVPYAAGGRTDLTNRILAQYIKNYLGQPVVVEVKPGASSVLGTLHVANSKPDGYTILGASGGLITAPYTVETPMNYQDFAPIGRFNYDPAVLAISPTKLKVKNLREFVEHARKNPKEVMVAVDPGTSNELHAMAFAKANGIEFRYIPYKGGGERIVALSGGHVDAMFDVPVTVKSAVQAGKAKIIGVGSAERFQTMESIETFKEIGTNLVLGSFNGWTVHKKTPPAIVKTLENALEKATRDPEFIKTLTNSDAFTGYLTAAEFFKFLAAEDTFIKQLAEALGMKPKKMP